MESSKGGDAPPEKPNKLMALVNRFLRKGQNHLPEQPKTQPEVLPDNPEELAERNRLMGQVSRKVITDILTGGFTLTGTVDVERHKATDMVVGLINAGRRYRAELSSNEILNEEDPSHELTLTVNDLQNAYLGTREPTIILEFTVHRERSKWSEYIRRWNELKSQLDRAPNTHEPYEPSVIRKRFMEGFEVADEQSAIIQRLPAGYSWKNPPPDLPDPTIAEQVQFLREILGSTADPQFTAELYRTFEGKRWGNKKIFWNKDNLNPSINLGSGPLLPPK